MTLAGVPILVKSNSSVYSPIVQLDSPVSFPTLNLTLVHRSGQETAESYSVISNLEKNMWHLLSKDRLLSEIVHYLKEELMDIQKKLKVALCLKTPESQKERA